MVSAWRRFRWNNWYVGKFVELTGNKVKFRGSKFVLDNPLIPTGAKSSLFLQSHENVELDFSNAFLDLELPTIEFGGSIGVQACLTNKRLARPAEHVVVEANPAIVGTLMQNRILNDCQFEIVAAAIGSREPMIHFEIAEFFLVSRISVEGPRIILVPTVSLEELITARGFEAINLQIDIEGAEVALIEDEIETFRRHVKNLVMETHAGVVGAERTARMLQSLQDAGFERVGETPDDQVVAYRNRGLDVPVANHAVAAGTTA